MEGLVRAYELTAPSHLSDSLRDTKSLRASATTDLSKTPGVLKRPGPGPSPGRRERLNCVFVDRSGSWTSLYSGWNSSCAAANQCKTLNSNCIQRAADVSPDPGKVNEYIEFDRNPVSESAIHGHQASVCRVARVNARRMAYRAGVYEGRRGPSSCDCRRIPDCCRRGQNMHPAARRRANRHHFFCVPVCNRRRDTA